MQNNTETIEKEKNDPPTTNEFSAKKNNTALKEDSEWISVECGPHFSSFVNRSNKVVEAGTEIATCFKPEVEEFLKSGFEILDDQYDSQLGLVLLRAPQKYSMKSKEEDLENMRLKMGHLLRGELNIEIKHGAQSHTNDKEEN